MLSELRKKLKIQNMILINDKGLLNNKTFMLTGKLNGISRAEAKSLIEQNSGKIISNVNKKLNYLIAGEKPTIKKINTARELNIKIIDQKELLKMLTKQNVILEKEVENEIHTIEISDRKTSYEDEQNIYIGWWSKHLKSMYWFLILLFICGIMLTSRYIEKRLWGIVFLLIIYPYIANFIFYVIARLYNLILRNIKSVYLD